VQYVSDLVGIVHIPSELETTLMCRPTPTGSAAGSQRRPPCSCTAILRRLDGGDALLLHGAASPAFLIELLVVIVILGILAAVVVFSVRGAGNKGKKAAVATDSQIIRTALGLYCARTGQYPKAVAGPTLKTRCRFWSTASP